MSGKIRKLGYEELKSSRPTLEELGHRERFPISVVLENIRSLYNVGSIFRTSDGACIEKIYLCGYTGYPPRSEIDKTALGSVESVPWEYNPDPINAVQGLKEKGYIVVALEHTDGSMIYGESQFDFPLCLVLGNEVEGISEELLRICDRAVEIPMYGIKQSLNVSVAFGILAYHLVQECIKSRIPLSR